MFFFAIWTKIIIFATVKIITVMNELIGRVSECEQLNECLKSQRSEFIIIYGRRRIGKTFLVKKFFDQKFSFYFTGAHNMPYVNQLERFAASIKKYSKSKITPQPKDWYQAFDCLVEYLESLPEGQRKVIFIDEMPWIDTHKSDFVTALENFWNSWAALRDDIVFIACGSATSWLSDKLIENQGGLHNRITRRIYLRPFTLNECEKYLQCINCVWDKYQIVQCYMILGGVPFYYSLLNPKESLVQNIDSLFFKKSAKLQGEFDELYSALFASADKYIAVVKELSLKREGLTRNEIMQSTGISGGGLTRIIDNLEKCDFISGYSNFNNKNKNIIYRLTDFYTLFYFHFIESKKQIDPKFWEHNYMSPKINAWQGYTFELVCLTHIEQIKVSLGISGISTSVSAWRGTYAGANTQIDLIIDRGDRIINICEIKFSSEPYVITKDYEAKLRLRNAIFKSQTKTRKALATTFITVYGVMKNIHSGVVQNEVTAEELFR